MKVVILTLITGEQLLCERIDPDWTGPVIRIKNPVAIMVVPSKDNPREPSVGLAPWGQFSQKREFPIQRSHILLEIDEPVQDFVDQYKTMFGAILTPNNRLILPT
jgi:hypothetical protein